MEYAINNGNVPRWEFVSLSLSLLVLVLVLALVKLPLALVSPTRGAAGQVEISTFLYGLRLYGQERTTWLGFTFDCFIFICLSVWGPLVFGGRIHRPCIRHA